MASKKPARATTTLPSREQIADIVRDVRAHMLPGAVAYSADGRGFSYEAEISADIEVGGWVILTTTDRRRYLAQVVTEEITIREGPAVTLDLASGSEKASGGVLAKADGRVRLRLTTGSGTILARISGRRLEATGSGDTFDEATVAAADGATVGRYLDAMGGKRARLAVGGVERCADPPPMRLRADGFDRHTFLCGQSGSGKTYALGLVLEQLILRTDLNIVVLDPNSDFVRISDVRAGVPTAAAGAYKKRAKELSVLRPPTTGVAARDTLLARFSDLAETEQAAALRLDPLTDREEYAVLAGIGDALGAAKYSLDDVLAQADRSTDPGSRDLALRIRNLGVCDWSIWARGNERTSAERLGDEARGIILDIGSIASEAEKAAVSATVLGNLWRRRARRRPTLIVIDEAHNVCPAQPTSALQANATEYCINIAAEGRKFGLYLLVSTQRPQKVHPNVLSQCDNLMLMRMNSRADLAELSSAFSFVPPSLLDESTRFVQGETLLAGKIVPAPMIARVGGRVSEEGGADIPASWADRRR